VGTGKDKRINGEAAELVYLGDAALDDFAVLKVPKKQDISVLLSLSFAPRDDFLFPADYWWLSLPILGTLESGSIIK
jgi:hypothetical protein